MVSERNPAARSSARAILVRLAVASGSIGAAMAVVLSLGAAPLGCSSGKVAYDGSADPPGCRPPSACYRRDCACDRGNLSSCVTCDPSDTAANPKRDCECNAADVVCGSAASVCVGRAAATCEGSGARCLPAGASCMESGGVPPQMVPSRTASAAYEPRCAYADDVCCPGAMTDGG